MLILKQIISSTVKRNALANLLRIVLSFPLSLFFTYFVIKKLSLEEYGTWAISLSLFSLFGFFDLGLSSATIRFISFYKALKKEKTLNQAVNTVLIFYFFIGLGLTIFLLFCEPYVLRHFSKKIPAALKTQEFIYYSMVFAGFLNFFLGVFASMLNGFQRMELTNLTEFLKTLILVASGFLFLSRNANLTSLVFAFIFAVVIANLSNFLFCKLIFRKLSLSLKHFNKKLLMKMLKFGFKTQFSSLAFYIHANFDKIIIGYFLGLGKVAFLDIALKLINQTRLLASALISPLLPAVSAKTAQAKATIFDFYKKSFKYVGFFSGLLFVLLIIFSPIFIRVWLGEGFKQAALAVQILALGHLINLLTGPGAAVLLAQNNPNPLMYASMIAGLANIVFSLVGVFVFGFYGAIGGTALSLILVDATFTILMPKFFKHNDS